MRSLKAAAQQYLTEPIVNFLRRSLYRLRSERYDFLRKALNALQFNGITGDYAEFGCHRALTFRMAYRILATQPVGPFHLWAFDSFQGFPGAVFAEDIHPRCIEGNLATSLDEFHRLCRSSSIPRGAYTTVPGFYEQSLDPSAPDPRPEKIRLAFIDCVMYSSAKAVLQFLMPRLQHGMILAFDDYYCYSSTEPSGERLAIREVFASNPQWGLLPYIQFGLGGMSFIVEAVGTGKPNGNLEIHW